MASDNVERVRAIYEPWSRGDWFGPADWADPDIEYVMADGPNPGAWRGIRALAAVWRETISPFSEFRVAIEEMRELDDGRVLVLTRNTGRGKTSGLELGDMQTRGANVLQFRDDKVTRLVAYFNRDLALADLGLQPPP